jgi:hypothetical protein
MGKAIYEPKWHSLFVGVTIISSFLLIKLGKKDRKEEGKKEGETFVQSKKNNYMGATHCFYFRWFLLFSSIG